MKIRAMTYAGIAAGIMGAWLTAAPAWADDAQTVQQAAEIALAPAADSLAAAKDKAPEVANVAVVPLRGDVDGYLTERVRDLVTQTPFGLFTREDESAWKDLLAEIEWGVRREDIMNPETVQRFGKIEGVDAILYGIVWDNSVNLWSIRGHAKLSLVLADVETGEQIWRSGPLEGEAFIHWSDALAQFWRFPALLIISLLLLVIIALALRSLRKAYKPL